MRIVKDGIAPNYKGTCTICGCEVVDVYQWELMIASHPGWVVGCPTCNSNINLEIQDSVPSCIIA